MTFNEGARGEAGRVQVQGGGGGSRGSKMAIGGGAGGIIVLILALLFGGDPGSLLGGLSSSTDTASSSAGLNSVDDCTGAQANNDVNCRVTLTVGSLDDVWEQQLIKQTGTKYVRPEVVLFSGSANTGCGQASSDVGPFYCPADQTAYFDTSFFQLLVDRFGSSAGPLAQEYVVAHEFGHHLQNQLGDIGRAQSDPQGEQSGAVRTELQADCYAGVWAHYADTIPDQATGQPFLAKLSQTDIRDALSAASSVGDDRIQKASTGRVNPEGWTHGSSDQRQKWFLTGHQSGQVSSCDTYSARDLNNPPGLKLK